MYDDNNVTYRLGINWFDILVKIILLIVFVVILLVLFPKADLDVFYDSIYTNNINTMKEAAKSYYTVDRLPSTVGESTSMSLKEMVDNHMLIRFKDKDEKYCDETTSGVEVSKTSEDSYVLKVTLNCGDQKDFILETIGCTTVCSNGTCTVVTNNGGSSNVADSGTGSTNNEDNYGGDVKNPTSVKDVYVTTVTLYQHKRAINSTQTVYTCPEGYIRTGTTCTKGTTGATIDATPIYGKDVITTTPAKYNDGDYKKVYTSIEKKKTGVDYSCPSGYTLNGAYCIKYVDATVEYGDTTYTCPTGYTKNGTKCTKTYSATYNSGNTSYSCPNGGTLSGTKCTITQSASASTTYTCPSGYTKNGTTCTKTYTATSNTTYSCPNGGTLSGTKCVTSSSSSYNATAKTTYSCPNGGTLSGTKCVTSSSSSYNATANKTYGSWYVTGTKYYTSTISVYTHDTEKVTFDGAVSGAVCGSPCGNKGIWYKYTYYARSVKTTYSCPNGGTLSGTKCVTTSSSSYNATAKTTYSCPNGGTLSGTKCVTSSSSSYNATASTSYTCPNGGTRSGSTCTLTATATASTTYTCPSGYTKNGTSCTKTYDATKNTGNGYYSCPNGGTLSGTTCTITTNATANEGETTYTCPYGYTKSGKTCYKKISADEEPVYEYVCPSGYTKAYENSKYVCYKYTKTNGSYYCENADATLDLANKTCTTITKGAITGYTCPTGYTQNNDKCTKYTNVVIDATVSTSTYTSYEYTWSEKSYLEGWVPTGATKTQNKTYNAGQK